MKTTLCLLAVIFLSGNISKAELPGAYQSLSATAKQSLLWDKVTSTEYKGGLPTKGPGLKILKLLCSSITAKFFNHVSDERPPSEASDPKLIHTYGSVAKVRFVPEGENKYTGIFKTGAIGLMRMSLAAQGGTSFTPGAAIKLFVDGKPSQNLHVMFSLEGQGADNNPFANIFSNKIPEPSTIPLKIGAFFFNRAIGKMTGTIDDAGTLPLHHVASVDAVGRASEVVKAPYQLFLEPTAEAKLSPELTPDMREKLKDLSPGQVLYSVFAVNEGHNWPYVRVGSIVLESDFVASQYGDQTLYFQHGTKPR